MTVICFRHPDYDGTSSPVLSCKTCCGLFLAELKRQHAAKGGQAVDTQTWLEDKKRQAREATSQTDFGFNPGSI